MVEVTDQFVAAHGDDLRLFVRRYAEGRPSRLPVACLHGLTRNSNDFEELAPHIARQGHAVFAFDQRGRGQSDWDNVAEHYEPLTYCRDMIAALDELGIERAIIIGTSMGGIMGMIMAATSPQRVAALVLNDVGPEVSAEGLQRIRGYVGKSDPIVDWNDAAAAVRANNIVALPDYTDEDWIAFARRTYRKTADGMISPAYDPEIARGLAPADPSAVPPDLWALWKSLPEIPILAIRGAHSDILSETTLDETARSRAHVSTAVIPNRGHAPMLDEPAALSAFDQFLARLER